MGNHQWLYKSMDWGFEGKQIPKTLSDFTDNEILELSIEEYEQLIKTTRTKEKDFWERFNTAYSSRYGATRD